MDVYETRKVVCGAICSCINDWQLQKIPQRQASAGEMVAQVRTLAEAAARLAEAAQRLAD